MTDEVKKDGKKKTYWIKDNRIVLGGREFEIGTEAEFTEEEVANIGEEYLSKTPPKKVEKA